MAKLSSTPSSKSSTSSTTRCSTKGYLLMRREGYFTIVPADERPDPTAVPVIKAEDLKDRAAREFVKVFYGPFKTVNAEDIAAEIKPMMGKYSWVTPLPKTNQIILVGQAAEVRAMIEHLDKIVAQPTMRIYTRVLEQHQSARCRRNAYQASGRPEKPESRAAADRPARPRVCSASGSHKGRRVCVRHRRAD